MAEVPEAGGPAHDAAMAEAEAALAEAEAELEDLQRRAAWCLLEDRGDTMPVRACKLCVAKGGSFGIGCTCQPNQFIRRLRIHS